MLRSKSFSKARLILQLGSLKRRKRNYRSPVVMSRIEFGTAKTLFIFFFFWTIPPTLTPSTFLNTHTCTHMYGHTHWSPTQATLSPHILSGRFRLRREEMRWKKRRSGMRMSPWGVEKSRKWCSEIHRFENEQPARGKERGSRRGRKGEKECAKKIKNNRKKKAGGREKKGVGWLKGKKKWSDYGIIKHKC